MLWNRYCLGLVTQIMLIFRKKFPNLPGKFMTICATYFCFILVRYLTISWNVFTLKTNVS